MKISYSIITFILCLFLVTSLHAEEISQSLQEKAAMETIPPESIIVPTQQEAGVISLQDDYSNQFANRASWSTAVKFGQITHYGSAVIPGTSELLFENLGSTLKPSLSVGVQSRYFSLLNTDLRFGMNFDGGFTAQDSRILTATQTKIESRLQYYDLSLRPSISIFPLGKRVAAKIYSEIGQAQIALASRSSTARFSKNTSFYGFGVALNFAVTPKWNFVIEYFERKPFSVDPSWSFASSQTQLGLEYVW